MSNAIPFRREDPISYEVVKMTPSMAETMLQVNKHNRPLLASDILKYAAEMEEGRWQFNGEAIKIGGDGVILDGQHRLHALALLEESTAIEFLIISGLPAPSQGTMDQGRKRSSADQLNLAGVTADKSLAAAIRVYMIWDGGYLFNDNKFVAAHITTPRIVEWAQENPDLISLFRDAAKYAKVKARRGVAYAIYVKLCVDHSPEAADEFFQRVLDGVGLAKGSPILALRARLDRIDTEGFRTTDRDIIGFFVRAFNAWVAGESLDKLQRPRGTSWTPSNFPKIVAP